MRTITAGREIDDIMSAERSLSPAARRVQQALDAAGLDCRVIEHAAPARTSAEVAATLGCAIGQIAKSLVFRAGTDGALLVVASGANRVDEAKLSVVAGTSIGKADPGFVRSVTGYAIGGIPPLAHTERLPAYIDRDLLQHPLVYAAGGTPNAMFAIRPTDLVRVAGGIIVDVALFASG